MPKRNRIEFDNGRGEVLAAALEMPDVTPRAYVLFAHCFTCGKDIAAASRLARGLVGNGFAVLRFDFTGLGGSEGDFGNTNFSSNTDDLIAAADYLRASYAAPELLVGHSLGGTAVLAAAARIPESRAVVTIGAPAEPAHVVKQFGAGAKRIEAEGEALVSLAGRDFRIARQFLDDVRNQPMEQRLKGLKRALLVLHAPFDEIVPIDQASRIFQAAMHPKSFISLDGADHLLSRAEDARYVADTIAAWSARYLAPPVEPSASRTAERRNRQRNAFAYKTGESVRQESSRPEVNAGEVKVVERNKRFLRGVYSDDHQWFSDEPKKVGGDNLGPDPYEQLLAALGTCTSMTLRMYANRKKLSLDDVRVTLSHDRDYDRDCDGCDEKPMRIETLRRRIEIEGDLSDAERRRLVEIADRCPVHRTLEGELRIETLAG